MIYIRRSIISYALTLVTLTTVVFSASGCSTALDSKGVDPNTLGHRRESCNEHGIATIGLNALHQFKSDDYDDAVNTFTQALAENPSDANSYVYRGLSYYRSGHFDSAVKDFDQAIKLNPNLPELYFDRALSQGSNSEKAITDYTRAIELNPDYALAYNNRGNLYERQLRFIKARSDKIKAVTLNPFLIFNAPVLWMALFLAAITFAKWIRARLFRSKSSSQIGN